jgi:hypothetical protein
LSDDCCILEFLVWGAWYVTMGTGWARGVFRENRSAGRYGTTALAAIISPFFVGMIADRVFCHERLLECCTCSAGGDVLRVPAQHLRTLYAAVLHPTRCLHADLALTQLDLVPADDRPGREFPPIACSARWPGSSRA